MEEHEDQQIVKSETRTGRPLGRPKTGGRKKGTTNRSTMRVIEAVEASGYSPIDRLLELAIKAYDDGDERSELSIIGKLMPYVYAQRKPIDPEDMMSKDEVISLFRENHVRILSALNFVLNQSQISMMDRQKIMAGMHNAIAENSAGNGNGSSATHSE